MEKEKRHSRYDNNTPVKGCYCAECEKARNGWM